MAKFKTAVGTTPYVVEVTDKGVSAHRANDSGQTWKFNQDLKPVAFDRGPGSTALYYDVAESARSSGLAAITAVDELGVSIPRGGNGVSAIPEALTAIAKASEQPTFPADVAERVPAAFANIGQPVPQLQR